jgi:putative salt-induced outer membrane protein YdiY
MLFTIEGIRPRVAGARSVSRPMPPAACRAALAALAALAGLAAPAARADDIPYGDWRGPVGLSVSLASGNTEALTAALSADLSRRTEFDKTIVSGIANYGKAAGTTTANRWQANGEYHHDLDDDLFGLVKLGLQRDQIQRLSLRTAGSLGLGLHVVRTPRDEFDVFGGVGYSSDRYSELRTIDGRTDTRFSRRELVFGEESTHRINDGVTLKQRLEIYPAISGSDGQRANVNVNLGVAMSRNLSLTVGLSSQYNSRPPLGFRHTDTLFLTGIALKVGE